MGSRSFKCNDRNLVKLIKMLSLEGTKKKKRGILGEESGGCSDLLDGRDKALVEMEYSWFWPLENDTLLM